LKYVFSVYITLKTVNGICIYKWYYHDEIWWHDMVISKNSEILHVADLFIMLL